MTDVSTNMRLKLPATCFILEIILIILFGTLVQYDHETDAKKWHNQTHADYENDFYFRYPSECAAEVWTLEVRGYGAQSVLCSGESSRKPPVAAQTLFYREHLH